MTLKEIAPQNQLTVDISMTFGNAMQRMPQAILQSIYFLLRIHFKTGKRHNDIACHQNDFDEHRTSGHRNAAMQVKNMLDTVRKDGLL